MADKEYYGAVRNKKQEEEVDKEYYGAVRSKKQEEEVEVQERGLFDFMKKDKEEKLEEYGQEEDVLVTGGERVYFDEGNKLYEKKEEERFYEEQKKEEEKFYEEEEKEDEMMYEEKVDKKKESLLDKIHRTHSSSSSDEEYEEVDGERRKKKKGLKEKIKERLHGEKKDYGSAGQDSPAAAITTGYEDTSVVVEKVEEPLYKVESTYPRPEKAEEPNYTVQAEKVDDSIYKVEEAPVEKKGFLQKIKEKLPGHHHKKPTEEEETTYPPPAQYTSLNKEMQPDQYYDEKEKKVEESIYKAEATPAVKTDIYTMEATPVEKVESIYIDEATPVEKVEESICKVEETPAATSEEEKGLFGHHHHHHHHHKQPADETVYSPPAPAQYVNLNKETEAEEEAIYKVGATPVSKVEESIYKVEVPEEEKKGFLEKIKEKLPGGHHHHQKKHAEEAAAYAPPPSAVEVEYVNKKQEVDTYGGEGEAVAVEYVNKEEQEVESYDGKEKKGILGKIMEKLPGYNRSGAEEKEIEKKESADKANSYKY